MHRVHISVVVRIVAAVASCATTVALLSAVVSLREPQWSQLIAANASRQMASRKPAVLLVQSKQAQAVPVADATAR